MCRDKCGDDWDDRKYMTMVTWRLISQRYGGDAAECWLWNQTPWPADLPTWDQIARAL